jgi:hypothetical protein
MVAGVRFELTTFGLPTFGIQPDHMPAWGVVGPSGWLLKIVVEKRTSRY